MLYYPSIRLTCYELLAHLKNHKLLQEPIVLKPDTGKKTKTPVYVSKYRLYDGNEYIEPGLTLSVFPAYSSKDFKSGFRSNNFSSVNFKHRELGSKRASVAVQDVVQNIAISLHYQETAVNEITKVHYSPLLPTSTRLYDNPSLMETESFEVEVNIGEEILRDYIEVIRFALTDFSSHDLNLQSLDVESYDFPTTSWDKNSAQIYFHYAYMMVKLRFAAPFRIENFYPVNSFEFL